MTAVAGYTEDVYVRTDSTVPTAADKVDGITDFSLSRSGELVDTTDFKDGSGYRTRIQALKDTSASMSGQFEALDAVQKVLRTAYETGATVHVTVHTDPSAATGSKGWRVPMLVESYEASGAVAGVGSFSCQLQGNGAPVAV